MFDINAMECVSSCNDAEIYLTNVSGSLDKVCKVPEIYVDPLSTKEIELGTQEYPFRTMKSAAAEILNLWSNSDYNVSVLFKDVYLMKQNFYFVNTESITFKSHPDYTSIGRRAVLNGTYIDQPGIHSKTLFHLFQNTDLLVHQVIVVLVKCLLMTDI